MGTPTFFWYPDPSGDLETIDLGAVLSDLQVTPLRGVVDARSVGGRLYRTVLDGRLRVRIVLERFTSVTVATALESMQAHLERGSSVGFSADSARAWAGFTQLGNAPSRDDAVLFTTGNVLSAWPGASTLAAGDYVCVDSPNPEKYREFVRVSGAPNAFGRLGLTDLIRYTYELEPVLVRHRDCWPALKLPDSELGRNFVLHDHRISYTLDLTLEEDTDAVLGLYSDQSSPLLGAQAGLFTPDSKGGTLDRLAHGTAGAAWIGADDPDMNRKSGAAVLFGPK